MKYLFLLPLLLAFGCSTGEGPKQYNFGDTYVNVFPNQDPTDVYVEMFNQSAASETGRDRTTKPSMDLSVPVSAVPSP